MDNIKCKFWTSIWFFVFFFLVLACFFFYLVGVRYPWVQGNNYYSREERVNKTVVICESKVRPYWPSCGGLAGDINDGDIVIILDKFTDGVLLVKYGNSSERALNGGCLEKIECTWTEGEQAAFITLFVLGGIFFFITIYCACELEKLSKSIANDQLNELNKIIYHNGNLDFLQLKTKVLNLKSEELDPQLKTSQTRLTNLITKLQNKVNNDAKAIIDLYLQAHAQMIAQNKEHDTFVQGQLTNYEVTLQNHLTKEELQSLRMQQKETLDLEERLKKLRGTNHLRGN